MKARNEWAARVSPCRTGALWTNRNYRKISNIRRTKSQNLNDSHLVLKSSLPNPLKPGVKSITQM